MPLKLPDTATPVTKRTPPGPKEREVHEPVRTGDTVEYSITMEVSPERGRKAWVKFGTTSSVRDGESTEQAVARVSSFVESEIDRRIDNLA